MHERLLTSVSALGTDPRLTIDVCLHLLENLPSCLCGQMPFLGRSLTTRRSRSEGFQITEAGTSYGEDDVFDLSKMEPYNLEKLHKSFTKYSKELVLYLPRNSDLNQIARYVPEGQKLEVAHYAIMAASKVSG